MARIDLVTGLLDANSVMAQRNKDVFKENKNYVINLMGVPGCGKTTVLERVIAALKEKVTIGVVEGDLYTTKDAERINGYGIATVQINTVGECHLDAATVGKACLDLSLKDIDLLVIENIGNLVCPAEFELGEDVKVLVLSVAEGNDKPWKYPLMFRKANIIIVNKMDLISYTDFDIEQFKTDMKEINPEAEVWPVSARTGAGIRELTEWLYTRVKRIA
ncbi:MAG: hypB [Firmicutes bacterium]|nr:hypB [Bacillota bacterium]